MKWFQSTYGAVAACPRCGRRPVMQLLWCYANQGHAGSYSQQGWKLECRKWLALRLCFGPQRTVWQETCAIYARGAEKAANALWNEVAAPGDATARPMSEGGDDDELPEATLSTGYMGDPEAWCYWDTEYPDEGSCGPFSSRAEAAEHAASSGYIVPAEAPTDPAAKPGSKT